MDTGIITRVTNGVPQVPSTLDRLASWLSRSALTRAAASLGNEDAMNAAPNIVPMHKPTRMQAVVYAICAYCHDRGYAKSIERDAARFAVRRLRCGCSGATAARAATLRADHLADVYGEKGVA